MLIAFSDAKGTPEAGEGSQEQEAVEEGKDEGQGEEGAVGGKPECDPLDIATNVDVEHEEEQGEEGEGEEEDEDDDDDNYDLEEDEYLNKFINKDLVVSPGHQVGQTGRNLF